jgi:hypothetical protein
VDINRLTLCAGRCVSSDTVHILVGVCKTPDVGAAIVLRVLVMMRTLIVSVYRLDDGEKLVLLDSPSTTTVVKNVIRHVTDVLLREFMHSTSIGPELSKQKFYGLYGVD